MPQRRVITDAHTSEQVHHLSVTDSMGRCASASRESEPRLGHHCSLWVFDLPVLGQNLSGESRLGPPGYGLYRLRRADSTRSEMREGASASKDHRLHVSLSSALKQAADIKQNLLKPEVKSQNRLVYWFQSYFLSFLLFLVADLD